MNEESILPDPAAVFGCALSLWHECKKPAKATENVNLSTCYNGGDEFMRVVMRVATRFENWASDLVAFEELDDVWPYMMEDKFGAACVDAMGVENLAAFTDSDCLRVALRLRLPVKTSSGLPVPIDLVAPNPVRGSAFRAFRIRTMRDHLEDTEVFQFTGDDEPFDEEYGPLFLGLYGVCGDGTLEHIADRRTYKEAVELARALSPGILFPECPTFSQGETGRRGNEEF